MNEFVLSSSHFVVGHVIPLLEQHITKTDVCILEDAAGRRGFVSTDVDVEPGISSGNRAVPFREPFWIRSTLSLESSPERATLGKNVADELGMCEARVA